MDLTQKRYWASTLQFIELQKLPACRKMIIFHDTAKQVMPNHSWTQSRMLERATAYAVSHPCTSNQSWSENELSPNERNPKTVCSNFTSRTNPNENIYLMISASFRLRPQSITSLLTLQKSFCSKFSSIHGLIGRLFTLFCLQFGTRPVTNLLVPA